jgi:hypothetical protein
MIVGLVVVAVGGTAIAIAATSNNPVPGSASLAAAIHRGLSAKPVQGITASVSFTNNLISSSDLQSSDPILTGASGRLWVGGGRLRLELQSTNGDAEIVVDHNSFSIYDPSTNTVYEGTTPSGTTGSSSSGLTANGSGAVPTIDQINAELKQLAAHLDITDPERLRQCAGLHRDGVSQARRRAARRHPARLGRQQRGSARLRRARKRRHDRAGAAGD